MFITARATTPCMMEDGSEMAAPAVVQPPVQHIYGILSSVGEHLIIMTIDVSRLFNSELNSLQLTVSIWTTFDGEIFV